MMKNGTILHNTVKSKQDATIKFVVGYDDGTKAEVSYIDKNDGKEIICCPTQTSCRMGCKFCFLTSAGDKLKARSLTADEMTNSVMLAIKENPLKGKKLLVSYMGSGEPLLNWREMVVSMLQINVLVPESRFAFATSLPKAAAGEFIDMINYVSKLNLDIKAHLSLHFTTDADRQEYMPASLDIATSITLLELYKNLAKHRVEVHYTLMDGVNDGPKHALELRRLLGNRGIPLKLLYYSENPALDVHRSNYVDKFMNLLKTQDLEVEFYQPPGQDIGASCGQFFVEDAK